MIVPFPPGGVADTVARPVAEALARELKQPVVVENRVGAGGAVGIGAASRAAGRRLHHAAEPVVDLDPARGRQDPRPQARLPAEPVQADRPLHGRPDRAGRARRLAMEDASPNSSPTCKAKPGQYNYGSSGNYGTMHVPMEMLKAAAGFRMTHIPYTGAGPGGGGAARRAGRRDGERPVDVVQQIQAGKLRALAHWGEQPLQRAARRAEPEAARPSGAASRSGRRCSCRPARPTTIVQKLRAAARQGRGRSRPCAR